MHFCSALYAIGYKIAYNVLYNAQNLAQIYTVSINNKFFLNQSGDR